MLWTDIMHCGKTQFDVFDAGTITSQRYWTRILLCYVLFRGSVVLGFLFIDDSVRPRVVEVSETLQNEDIEPKYSSNLNLIQNAWYSLSRHIQEFYEITLLDDTKSIQQKTAETLQIASKWENSPPLASLNQNNEKYRYKDDDVDVSGGYKDIPELDGFPRNIVERAVQERFISSSATESSPSPPRKVSNSSYSVIPLFHALNYCFATEMLCYYKLLNMS
ncbi:uncharacterized protein TNCT_382511 [Trichonephila clavata]|uniref:Uncharacterized protein n=1 Tax=Trichonephila clavata TaxID=2740835 RepID=A0A8X6JI12_TRICU|nr:uncharacterized protein TNCT_382511 [Trichonephila clavata]